MSEAAPARSALAGLLAPMRARDDRFQRWPVLAVIALGLALRLGAAVLLPDQSAALPDARTYRQAAGEIFMGRLISSDLVMPGYPLLIALGGGSGTWQLVLDIAASTAAIWLVHRLAWEVTGDALAALVAAIGWAIHPFAAFYVAVGLTETVFVTLLLLAFLGLYRRRYWPAALALVAAILVRPSIELLAPVLVVAFAVVVHRGGALEARRSLLALATVYVVGMLPWWLHNEAKYHAFVRLNLGGGLALYAGNNPMNTSGGGIEGVDYDVSAFRAIADPVQREAAMRTAAFDFIVDRPGLFLQRAAVRFGRLWQPWPHAVEYSSWKAVAVSLLATLPLLVLASAGTVMLLRDRFRPVLPPLLLIAYLTAVHMITIGSIRYRFPIEPFLVVLAAPAAAALVRRVLR